MGGDKSWVEIEGRPMIAHALGAASAVAGRLSIVISAGMPERERYETLAAAWGAEVIADLHDHRGPLGGIHTALRHLHGARSQHGCDRHGRHRQDGLDGLDGLDGMDGVDGLMLACDLPFVSPDFLRWLAQIHEAEANDFTAPVDRNGRLQPLAGFYGPACLPAVETMLAAGVLRVDRIGDVVKTRRVSFEEYAGLPGAERFLLNVNAPADLDQLEAARATAPPPSRTDNSLACPPESTP
jgi:molybdopterin-guanine dinucleotide biosynthesis protein A